MSYPRTTTPAVGSRLHPPSDFDYPGRCAVPRTWMRERNGPSYPLSAAAALAAPRVRRRRCVPDVTSG